MRKSNPFIYWGGGALAVFGVLSAIVFMGRSRPPGVVMTGEEGGLRKHEELRGSGGGDGRGGRPLAGAETFLKGLPPSILAVLETGALVDWEQGQRGSGALVFKPDEPVPGVTFVRIAYAEVFDPDVQAPVLSNVDSLVADRLAVRFADGVSSAARDAALAAASGRIVGTAEVAGAEAFLVELPDPKIETFAAAVVALTARPDVLSAEAIPVKL